MILKIASCSAFSLVVFFPLCILQCYLFLINTARISAIISNVCIILGMGKDTETFFVTSILNRGRQEGKKKVGVRFYIKHFKMMLVYAFLLHSAQNLYLHLDMLGLFLRISHYSN